MNIFLSYNHKDKTIVEPIAVILKSKYGEDSVFYDSWSVKPGDGIIDKMNTGLEKCDFFFFFISNNSIHSEMVKLEWQNALVKAAKKELRFIPVRVDNCSMPAILLQILNIDLNKVGFNFGVRQIIDVIDGICSMEYQKEFENFAVELLKIHANEYKLTISVKYYFEPEARFLIFVDEDVDKISINCLSECSRETNKWNNLILSDGSHRALYEKSDRGLSVGFPYVIILKSDILSTFNVLGVSKAVKADSFRALKMKRI